MIDWILMNLATILVLIAVVLIVGGSVYSLVRENRKGSACGGCAGCPNAGKCRGH